MELEILSTVRSACVWPGNSATINGVRQISILLHIDYLHLCLSLSCYLLSVFLPLHPVSLALSVTLLLWTIQSSSSSSCNFFPLSTEFILLSFAISWGCYLYLSSWAFLNQSICLLGSFFFSRNTTLPLADIRQMNCLTEFEKIGVNYLLSFIYWVSVFFDSDSWVVMTNGTPPQWFNWSRIKCGFISALNWKYISTILHLVVSVSSSFRKMALQFLPPLFVFNICLQASNDIRHVLNSSNIENSKTT